MDKKTCEFIAQNGKYKNTLILYHAWKVVVQNITSTDVAKRQTWIPCLSHFNVQHISWSQNAMKTVLALASVLSPTATASSVHIHPIIVQFLRDLCSTQVYTHLPKYIHGRGNDLGAMEWRAIRNICTVVTVPLSVERSVIMVAQSVLESFSGSIRGSAWRSTVTSLEIVQVESAILSLLALLKVWCGVVIYQVHCPHCYTTSITNRTIQAPPS